MTLMMIRILPTIHFYDHHTNEHHTFNSGVMVFRGNRLSNTTPSPPTKSLDFEGFDSSKLLIIKGGNSHVRMIL